MKAVRLDFAVPLAIGALGTVEIIGLGPRGAAAAIALEWIACALLVLRRRWPLCVGLAAGLVLVPMPFVGPQLNDLSTPILITGLGVYALGRHMADLRGLAPLVVLLLAIVGETDLAKSAPDLTDVFFVGILLVPCYVAGRMMRLLAERAILLAEREESAKREAVAAERARMAREIHDVVAHTVSVMTVQAAAAEELLRVRPDDAAQALQEIQSAGRSALTETGRLLQLLRDTDDELGLAPEQRIDDVHRLIDEFRRSGLVVALTIDGSLGELPTGVAVSAYRLVREILTNGLKYAADRSVALTIRHADGTLEVATSNQARPAAERRGGGLGLVGMAERVAVHGGQISHGRTGERFHLKVSLPVMAE